MVAERGYAQIWCRILNVLRILLQIPVSREELSLDQFFKEVDMMPSASTSSRH
jgi:hypothetical protein